MKDLHVFEFVSACLKKQIKVALAIVVNVEGSTPGKPGFKMAVAENGTLKGSIGGGETEFELAEDIKAYFKTGKKLPALQTQILEKNDDPAADTPVCGGQQTVLIYECQFNDLAQINQLIELNRQNQSGKFSLSSDGFIITEEEQSGNKITFEVKSENTWKYEEHFSLENVVYIVGGGHVGLALSRILATLDFHIIVIDDRKDINTLAENSFAHQIICEPYPDISLVVPDNENGYIIIMTAGHKADELVLEKLIHKKVKYIGMMGSQKKIPYIFENLQNRGVSAEALKAVHAPIGVPIDSHTPAEIAVSIAAELIKVKNSNYQKKP